MFQDFSSYISHLNHPSSSVLLPFRSGTPAHIVAMIFPQFRAQLRARKVRPSTWSETRQRRTPWPSPTFPRKSIFFCLCEWIQYKCPSDRNAVAACSVRDVFVVSSSLLSCHWSYLSEGMTMILLLLYCVLSTFLWILLLVQLQQMQTNLIMMVIGNGSI